LKIRKILFFIIRFSLVLYISIDFKRQWFVIHTIHYKNTNKILNSTKNQIFLQRYFKALQRKKKAKKKKVK